MSGSRNLPLVASDTIYWERTFEASESSPVSDESRGISVVHHGNQRRITSKPRSASEVVHFPSNVGIATVIIERAIMSSNANTM